MAQHTMACLRIVLGEKMVTVIVESLTSVGWKVKCFGIRPV